MLFEDELLWARYLAEDQLEAAVDVLQAVGEDINFRLQPLGQWQCLLLGILATLLVLRLYRIIFPEEGFGSHLKLVFWIVRRLPIIKSIIKNKMNHMAQEIEADYRKDFAGLSFFEKLPQEGMKEDEILQEVERYQHHGKVAWDKGRASGAVYKDNNPKLEQLVTAVYGRTAWTNPLHFDIFPGVCKMEAEVVRIVCSLFNGGPASCGVVTSGGTESIFMACKAFRDYAYHVKGITKPEMVIPVSAHAAFDKAGQLLKIRVRHAPMVKATMQADLQAMRRAINKNTVMLVGSCPQFPHGIMDSISDIAKLGERYDIPVHVDSCLGGLLLPFMAEAGHPIPPFDFTLPGVTSISCDTHKYGFTPKGTSVVVYRDVKYRHYQFSVQPDWPGGIYCTPTLAGSRAGGTIAATWATLLYMGRQGYLESCRKIIASTRILVKGLRKIEGLIVYGDPQLSVVALGSNHFDIYRLCDALSAKGWNINMIQKPKGFHICVTLQHTAPGVIDDLLRDMRDCTAEIMKHPSQPATGNAAMYGTAQKIPDRSLVTELTWAFLDACYSTKPVPLATNHAS